MYRQSEKNLLNGNIFPICPPHNMVNFGSLAAEIGLPAWAPEQVSHVGFITAATSLNGGEPDFAQRLAVSWADTLCIHFWGLLPLAEFCKVQNSLCVQVLRSPILAALLNGTPAAGIGQTLRCGTTNGITELSLRRHLYLAGQPSRWASAHILV